MPFDPAKYAEEEEKKPFNPASYADDVEPELSTLDSAVSGTAQGLTFGFSDEIIGATRALAGVAQGEGKFDDLYTKYRDEQRAHIDKAKLSNPKSFLAGTVGGAVTTAKLPLGAAITPAKGAGVGVNVLKAGAAGALTGGGLSEAKDAKGVAMDAAIGGALGAGTQYGLEKISKAYSALKPDSIRKYAEERAVKAAGAMKKDFNKLAQMGKLHETGRAILDNKIVKAFGSLEGVAERAGQVREVSGQQIGAALDNVDGLVKQANQLIDNDQLFAFLPRKATEGVSLPTKEQAKKYVNETFQFNMKRIADRIQEDLVAPNASNPLLRTEMKSLSEIANDFASGGVKSLREGNIIKGTQGKITKFDSSTVPQAFKKEVYSIIRQEIDDVVGKIGNLEEAIMGGGKVSLEDFAKVASKNGAAVQAFDAAKKTYGAAKTVQDMANNRLGAVQSNRQVGLTDVIAGAGGFSGGGVPGMAALGLLSNLGRRYGASAQAVGADKLAEILSRSPEQLGKFAQILDSAAKNGTNALIAAHAALMKDPNYKRIIEVEKEEKNLPLMPRRK